MRLLATGLFAPHSEDKLINMKANRVRLFAPPLLLTLAALACALPGKPKPVATPTVAAAAVTTQAPTAAAAGLATQAATAPATHVPTATPTGGLTAVPATPANAGGCANPYFPVNTHSLWTYNSTDVLGDSSFVRRITNVSQAGFTVEENGRVQSAKQWACDHGNMQWLSGGQGSTTVMAGNTTATIDSVSVSGYRLPAVFAAGQTWSEDLSANSTVTQKGAAVGTGANVVKTTCADAGPEKIKVAAGAFDTEKITCHIDDASDVTINGQTQHIDEPVDTSEWYASGVGLIKSVSTGAPEVTGQFELSVYNP
jgi:hypothetical protein